MSEMSKGPPGHGLSGGTSSMVAEYSSEYGGVEKFKLTGGRSRQPGPGTLNRFTGGEFKTTGVTTMESQSDGLTACVRRPKSREMRIGLVRPGAGTWFGSMNSGV